MLQWQSVDIHARINVCSSILCVFAPRVPAAAVCWVLLEQGRGCWWWPSPCSAAGPQCVRAPVPPSAVPGRLKCPSPTCHGCEPPELTQLPWPVTASQCRWESTDPLVRDLAACFGPHTEGLSGLKKHPNTSELCTGMAIMSIKYNIYHNLLLKLLGDASPPFHGPELSEKASK